MKTWCKVLLVVLLSCGFISAQANVLIRVAHKQSMHPMGQASFSLGATSLWHGVILQGSARFVDEGGKPIPIAQIAFGAYDKNQAGLCFQYAQKCYVLKITEENLVRIVSWIDNGGTGVYTAHDLSQTDVDAAGMSPVTNFSDHYIVTEFSGSPVLERSAHYLDFPDDMFVREATNAAAIKAKWNAGLKQSKMGDGTKNLDYLVVDLDSAFIARLSNGRAVLSGTVFRYFRDLVPGNARAYVTRVEVFMEPSELKGVLATESAEIKQTESAIAGMLIEEMNSSARQHQAALEFAQIAASLRAVYAGNKTAWKSLVGRFEEPTPPKSTKPGSQQASRNKQPAPAL